MNIIITGASSGVGFEAVLELVSSGDHQVIALARSEEKLKRMYEIAKSLNPDCNLFPAKFDIVTDDYSVLLPFISQKFRSVDILINNAGVLINKPFEELADNDFLDMFQGNFMGHIKMIRNLLPLMNHNAHIVNIGSMGGFQGSSKFAGLSAYSASKSALHTLTECLAIELADRHIKVNCLALGSAQTEMLEHAFPNYRSPVMAFEMGKFIADFSLTGHTFFNGKILPVALTTP
jgi:NAD(P)-dependent dehydrogenase (short-subunit alcohol dehydrogenase family)